MRFESETEIVRGGYVARSAMRMESAAVDHASDRATTRPPGQVARGSVLHSALRLAREMTQTPNTPSGAAPDGAAITRLRS